MNKDNAIVIQVTAKIAAELCDRSLDTDSKIAEFAVLFSTIKDIVFDAINESEPTNTDTETDTTPTTSNLSIAGKQHGDLPDWLFKACKRDGVNKVYDNRDGLAVNPKRPWFKAVDSDKAYWPPRTK